MAAAGGGHVQLDDPATIAVGVDGVFQRVALPFAAVTGDILVEGLQLGNWTLGRIEPADQVRADGR